MQLIPLGPPALLGLFREVLESSLVERGVAQGLELLGHADEFWRAVPLAELQRMAQGGNAAAQAELAWRSAVGEGLPKSVADAVNWATQSAEKKSPAGEAVLGWLLYHGMGLPKDYAEAARLFEHAADAADSRGMAWLALCLLRGHGVSADVTRGSELLHKTAEQGSHLAQYWLGRLLYLGQYLPRDFAQAVRWLTLASEHNSGRAGRAADLLARCHFFGRGVEENRSEAVRLWRVAALDDVAPAMFSLGLCLYAGEGTAVNHAEAVTWFRAAARKRVAGAMFLLGQCTTFGFGVTPDPAVGLAWYRRAAERGNREAEFELAEAYAAGRAHLERDLEEAVRWWRAAARQGHARAQLKLGHCYRWGEGIEENKRLALAWYRRAADGGEVAAHVWLGECHEHGEGALKLSADPAVARQHYHAAAVAGEPHGLAELGRCQLYGIGGQVDVARGEAALKQAAEDGWQPALDELERYWFAEGERYFHGHGAVADAARARLCYRKAGELGHRRAAYMLAECLRHGLGGAAEPTQALTWYHSAATLFDAKLALADLYYRGEGVVCNYREAFRWFEQAVAQHEDAYALYSLGYCLLHGQGVRRDVRLALRHLRRAAVLGEVNAQYELGLAYYRGAGVVKNLRLAMKWLRMAANHGQDEARAFIERIERGQQLN
ncbi:MAG: sel1 repeat family protein [Gammaproteobacteria bacterium]|nr:sel1 repeat family protein [Gammaproteobacteria bacterium]MBU3989309.1 sel1 repeat family protein [Gammaproteobacteria bacterium]MBU4005398.1 sel1 repeat family protein [Gammaproteobacteria bacterium]MBU4021083.1 sel1 repeat family protein [Gammaproteobacteria bacterium]MBU4096100.1 sel1 repeat family protein [Gammaproteobacteria bacterium]